MEHFKMKPLAVFLATFGICSANIVRQTSSCGHAGYLTQDNGTIDSHPGFATNLDYHNDLNCMWTIQAPAGKAVQLSAKSFDLERHSPCNYDYLEVFDGDGVTGRSLGKFCGSSMSNVTSKHNFLTLHFVTDDDTPKKGFRLKYTFVNASAVSCGHAGYLTQAPGTIDSHKGFSMGAQYGDNLDCEWTIKAPAGMFVQLTAKTFDLERQSGCTYDYLEVLDGDGTSTTSLGKFCGTTMTGLTTTQNVMTLHFVTDTSDAGNGFRLQYKFTNISIHQLASNCGHRGYLTSNTSIIDSHAGFGTVEYGNDLDCKWIIKAPAGMYVELTPKQFDLESDDECDYDYLEIFDGDGIFAPSLGKFCGATFLPIESTQNIMTLHFVSDDDTRKAGFRFSYNFTLTYQRFCASGLFKCKNNNCIESTYRCDNDDDCGDDSDEMGCPRATCAGNKFLCNNTKCVDFNWICDGDDDCGDNSDEDPQSCLLAGTTASTASTRCGSLTKSGPIGTITSPGYPSNYGDDVSCVWKIVGPHGTTRISIKFEPTFNLEGSSSCGYDSVTIYADGHTSKHGPYCGTTAPVKFSIDGDHVFVEFKSDDSTSGTGFRLDWKALHF